MKHSYEKRSDHRAQIFGTAFGFELTCVRLQSVVHRSRLREDAHLHSKPTVLAVLVALSAERKVNLLRDYQLWEVSIRASGFENITISEPSGGGRL